MQFTKNDLMNLKRLLVRSTFRGLEEAKVAIVLEAKLDAAMAEEVDNGDVQTSTEQSS